MNFSSKIPQNAERRTQNAERSLLSAAKKLAKLLILSPLRFIRYYRHILNTKCRYKFFDRRKNSRTLIIILAGYKPFIWNDVAERIKLFAPPDADVCIVSSGMYDEQLAQTAEKNHWSYISTKRDCVTLALNIPILLHPKAEFIYKIDEDIIITKHLFEVLMKTYEQVKTDGLYDAGFVAPLIPVNVYGHLRVLEKLGITAEYENRFGKTGWLPFQNLPVWKNPDSAKFFWGEDNIVPHIDDIAERFYSDKFEYRACPIRFSVGCILFSRKTWQDIGMFRVPLRGSAMGGEEVQLCCLAMRDSLAVIVSENTAAGHLSFGPQNAGMKDYYLHHRDRFALKSE